MNKRLKEISIQLTEFSRGKFEKKTVLSARLDDTDAIANGINMLGDELKAITISRDYFTNIFNSVSDMIFIVDRAGIITDANDAAAKILGYDIFALSGRKLNELAPGNESFYHKLKVLLKTGPHTFGEPVDLVTGAGVRIPVRMSACYFIDPGAQKFMIITAGDMTYQIKANNLVLRAIIDTQEQEKKRFARDLHDTLTQQLTAIKFYISAAPEMTTDAALRKHLLKCNSALAAVIGDMRNISFNLMPQTLEAFGLVKALREFCDQLPDDGQTHYHIKEAEALPALTAEVKIDLYRIAQEFISNSLRHGKAKNIHIHFSYAKRMLHVLLEDDGCGFDASQATQGMGLHNVRSRVKSHNGEMEISSRPGGGTSYRINLLIT